MGYILSRVKASIQAAADAYDDLTRISYGDPAGSRIHFEGVGTFDRGKGWSQDHGKGPGLLDFLLEYGAVGELERAPGQFGTFSVSAAQVAPIIRHSNGVASVVKEETGIPPGTTCNYVTVTLDNAFKDNSFAVFVFFYGSVLIPKVTNLSASSFKLEGFLPTGVEEDLNDHFVGVLAMGNLV
jgi:hypothetical protein